MSAATASWNYGFFEEFIKNPISPLPDLNEARPHISLVVSRLQKEYLPQLARATHSVFPSRLSPVRDRSEPFEEHERRCYEIKIDYFNAVCDEVEKNLSFYWKKAEVFNFVNREVPRLRAFARIVKRIITPIRDIGPLSADDLNSAPGNGFFNALAGAIAPIVDTDSRCSTPTADQIIWNEDDDEKKEEDEHDSRCSTPTADQLIWSEDNKEKKEEDESRSSTPNESELTSEYEELELPVSDESTEEESTEDSDESNYQSCDEEIRTLTAPANVSSSSPTESLPSISPSSTTSTSLSISSTISSALPSISPATPSTSASLSVSSPICPVSTWKFDVKCGPFPNCSLPEKKKENSVVDKYSIKLQPIGKVPRTTFEQISVKMAAESTEFNYKSTLVDPAVYLNKCACRQGIAPYHEREQKRKEEEEKRIEESVDDIIANMSLGCQFDVSVILGDMFN